MKEFKEWPKMARLSREIIITEKIDGTNSSIDIQQEILAGDLENVIAIEEFQGTRYAIMAGSRNKWITPGKTSDNAGFAAWVRDNSSELVKLGEGHHFGEWWGQGIQRNYGLKEKRFSLFNVGRWENPDIRPKCCHVVPTLYRGEFDTSLIDITLFDLSIDGSAAAPGFMKPEGIIVWHTAANIGFKKTIEKDEVPKSLQ
jgi:hypothetical protein